MHSPHRRDCSVVAALTALVLPIAGLAACGGDDGPPSSSADSVGAQNATPKGTLAYKETEFAIAPAKHTANAGEVTFDVQNAGKTKHEFVVIKTRNAADELGNGAEADETGVVDEIEDIEPGKSQSLKLTLKPGHYALICNLPGHYKPSGKNGMLADLTVQ